LFKESTEANELDMDVHNVDGIFSKMLSYHVLTDKSLKIHAFLFVWN